MSNEIEKLAYSTELIKDYLGRAFALEKNIYEQTKLKDGIENKIHRVDEELDTEFSLIEKRSYSIGGSIVCILLPIILLIPLLLFYQFMKSPAGGAPDWFLYLLLALAVVLCGISIAGIISLIRTLIYVKAYNREAEKVNASNQSEFLRWRQEALAYRNDLVVEYDMVAAELKETEQALDQFYSVNVLYSKYQNMVAVSTIYEYLASERCYGLTGHEGAYNLYESEIRLGYIIGKLDNIDQNIHEMKHGQQMLYRAVQESRQASERLLQQEIHNGKMLQDIRESARVAEYSRQQAADRLGHMQWLQEQTFIWGK